MSNSKLVEQSTVALSVIMVCHCSNNVMLISHILDATYNRESPTWMALARAVMLCGKAEFASGQDSINPISRYYYQLIYMFFTYIFYTWQMHM